MLNFAKTFLWPVLFVLPLACTTSPRKEAEFPEEYLETSTAPAYGTIEDENESYQWTTKTYEDPRFAAQLDNAPTKPADDGIYTDQWVSTGVLKQERHRTGSKVKTVVRKTTTRRVTRAK